MTGGKLTDILHPSPMSVGLAAAPNSTTMNNVLQGIDLQMTKPIDRMLNGGDDDSEEERRNKFRKGKTLGGNSQQAEILKKRKSIFYALENVNMLGNMAFLRNRENAID